MCWTLSHTQFQGSAKGGRPQRKAERWFQVLFEWFQFRLQLSCESVGSSEILFTPNSLQLLEEEGAPSLRRCVSFWGPRWAKETSVKQEDNPRDLSINLTHLTVVKGTAGEHFKIPRTNPRHLPASVSIHEKM